jgi:hypothetical protein
VSQHIVESPEGDRKWVFGWDQPLQSFYLQVHFSDLEEDEANPTIYLGDTMQSRMYEVEDLVRACAEHGLMLAPSHERELYSEKDDGR